ncbi:MAG: MAPEG family protein [Bdellovibrionota bacterium]
MKNQLIFPMAFYIFYMWLLALLTFRTRLRAIKSGEVAAKYFRAYTGQGPSDRTILVARHYDHQFQVPLLFFITCLLSISIGSTNSATIFLAWLFVVSRLCHSWVHLGSNRLEKRVLTFAAGWVIVVLMWMQLVYFALQ